MACNSCKNNYDRTNGGGYQPCGCKNKYEKIKPVGPQNIEIKSAFSDVAIRLVLVVTVPLYLLTLLYILFAQ